MMKQLTRLIVCSATCFFLMGCFPWSKAFKEKDVMARFGTDDTGISSLLDIGGYYLSNDTAKDGVAFYKDGTIKRIDTGHGMNWFPISDGVYTISNDTIYAETFYYLGMNGGMQLAHLRFKVMDRNTIMLFEYAEDVGPRKMETLFRFVPSDSLPLPFIHMKQKRWMWTDKNKWKEYLRKKVKVKYWL